MPRGDQGGPRVWDLTKVIVNDPLCSESTSKGVTLGTKNGDSGRNGEWNQKWRQSLVCRVLLCIDRARRVDRHAASQVESPGKRSATHLGVPDLGNAHAKGNTPGSHACPPADHAAWIIHSSGYPGHVDDPTTTCSRPEAPQKQQRLDRPPTRAQGLARNPRGMNIPRCQSNWGCAE